MKTKEKVLFINSIKAKIMLMVFLAILAASGMCMWTFIPLIRDNMQDTIRYYMEDVVTTAGSNIDRNIVLMGAEATLTPEELNAIVGDIKIRDMTSSINRFK